MKKKLAKQARKLARETGRSVADCVAALQQVRKSSAPAQRLWPSAEAVLGEQARVNALRQTRAADGLVVKALQERVTNAKGVELVKAARANPFNRLGGPRHQL